MFSKRKGAVLMKGKKSGGFVGNLAKIGGTRKKLSLHSDMKDSTMVHPSMKKASKQAHKRA
jgi:hypothetical protein